MIHMPHEGVRRMVESDLDRVLIWRNHEDVRRFMYTQHEISIEEHARWFAKVSNDPKRHLLIVESAAVPFGFVNIHEIAAGGVADWGFYTAPDVGKGAGRLLGRLSLAYAFNKIGLHKVCGKALAYNERSIKFHERLGFKPEGVLRQQHFDGRDYHDVICLGLLSSEWQTI